mmetsp:Transcript_27237/g.54807  ORF Transcript_27237/g.54807 Transcript_27237/m.54807 type:complete len:107 (-) Transcript_27237:38-358(-)
MKRQQREEARQKSLFEQERVDKVIKDWLRGRNRRALKREKKSADDGLPSALDTEDIDRQVVGLGSEQEQGGDMHSVGNMWPIGVIVLRFGGSLLILIHLVHGFNCA